MAEWVSTANEPRRRVELQETKPKQPQQNSFNIKLIEAEPVRFYRWMDFNYQRTKEKQLSRKRQSPRNQSRVNPRHNRRNRESVRLFGETAWRGSMAMLLFGRFVMKLCFQNIRLSFKETWGSQCACWTWHGFLANPKHEAKSTSKRPVVSDCFASNALHHSKLGWGDGSSTLKPFMASVAVARSSKWQGVEDISQKNMR